MTGSLAFTSYSNVIYRFKGFIVKPLKNTSNSSIAEIIESRSPAGRQDSVQGWHNLLKKLLSQMTPYLKDGHLVTFRTLNDRERGFFEELHGKVTVPTTVSVIYMPPSVRFQMLYHRPEGEPRAVPDHSPENPPDEGIVLGCRRTDLNVIINALLAKPPFAPAIDVYDNGQLLAGYVYNTIDECIGDLTKVLQIHLKPVTNLK
jgi:hypothetical protein